MRGGKQFLIHCAHNYLEHLCVTGTVKFKDIFLEFGRKACGLWRSVAKGTGMVQRFNHCIYF